MIAIANIKLWNALVGVVFWDDLMQIAIFEFDQQFLKSNLDLMPIVIPKKDMLPNKTVYSYPELTNTALCGMPGFLSDHLITGFAENLINTNTFIKKIDSPVDQLCLLPTTAWAL